MLRPMTARQWTLDAVLAGAFFVLAGGIGLRGADGMLAIALCTAMAAALVVRRYAPALSLAIAWLAALAQMAAGLAPAPYDLAVFGVLYVTSAYGSRLVYWLGFASALAGALVATLYLQGGNLLTQLRSGDGGALVTAAFAWLAASFALLLAWTLGALVRAVVRSRASRLAQIQAESEAVAEQERVRIARDMHDVVAHSLAVVIAQADGARYAAAADPDAATAALSTISTTARAALADVRLLLGQLRHAQGDGPQPTLADLEELFAQARTAGLALRVTVDPAPPADPSASVQLAVYRILQEALTNAIRHGAGAEVEVQLAWHPDAVSLSVRNAVPGDRAADEGAHTAEGGHGLIGMRERAQLAGGTLDAGAEDGFFAVRARIPIGEVA